MKTLSVRGVDHEMAEALRTEAKRTNTSINATVLNLIRESIGLKKKERTRFYSDLGDLAGTWSDKDEQEFRERTGFFDRIDEDLWN